MGTYLGTQREISNEYQHDRVKMVFKIRVLVLWEKVASALEGLMLDERESNVQGRTKYMEVAS